MKTSIFVTLTFLSVLLFSNFSSGAEAIKIDFENGKTDGWEFIDDETAKPKDLLNGRSRMGNLMVNRSIKALIFGETNHQVKGLARKIVAYSELMPSIKAGILQISLWKWMFSPLTTTAWVLYGGLQVKINTIESS